MGVALGLILIAVGAALTWAVEADVSGLNIQVVGVILMIVGLAALLLDLLLWHSWRAGPWGARSTYVEGTRPAGYGYWGRRRRTVVEDDAGPPAGPPPP